MDAASGGDERMAFVRGLSRAQLAALCDGREAAIAIANPGDAFVIAGRQADVDAVAADAARDGAQRVAPVCVRIASHTRRLAAAVPVFRASLAAVRVQRPLAGTRLFSGIDGASVLDVDAGLDKLARQIAEPVEWAACLAACVEAGATAFLELGPGRALADMASRRCRRAASPISARSTASRSGSRASPCADRARRSARIAARSRPSVASAQQRHDARLPRDCASLQWRAP